MISMESRNLTRGILLASFLFTFFLANNFVMAVPPQNISVIVMNGPLAGTYTKNPITFDYLHYTNTTDSVQVVALLNGTAIHTDNPYTNSTSVVFDQTLTNGDYNLTVYAKDNVLNTVIGTNETDFTVNEYSQTASSNISSVMTIGIISLITAAIFLVIIDQVSKGSEVGKQFFRMVMLATFILIVILVLILLVFFAVYGF
jgi:hypothetical protein